MIGATLFSGIGAPELAAPWVDWAWSADIDDFANAVRAHHWPAVPNMGDVNAIDPAGVRRPDLIVFGSPCQSYSVAGKRLGMDDARGNMALVALALVERLKPRWFVFENVPGLFSSFSGAESAAREADRFHLPGGGDAEGDEDSDFWAFLCAVEEIGYSGAWRSLDAQYFGVPQRRERLFFVGCAGDDWRRSAAVLFEPESLRGDSPPGRGAAKDVAGSLAASAGRSRGAGIDAGGLIASTGDVAHCLNAGVQGRQDYETEALIAQTAFSLRAQPQLSHDPTRDTLIAFNANEDPDSWIGRTGPVSATSPMPQAVALRSNASAGDAGTDLAAANGGAATIESEGQVTAPDLRETYMVRRITPVEAERLQGFPDGFTDIPWRAPIWSDRAAPWAEREIVGWCKTISAPDSRRYKALGNSMAVPVMRWILDRLRAVDAAWDWRDAA